MFRLKITACVAHFLKLFYLFFFFFTSDIYNYQPILRYITDRLMDNENNQLSVDSNLTKPVPAILACRLYSLWKLARDRSKQGGSKYKF